MSFQKVAKFGASLGLALLLGAPLLAAGPNVTANPAVESTVNWYAPDRVSTLLQDLRTINSGLANHGETLESIARAPHFSWQSHAHYLNALRGQINDAGKIISELQSIKHGALPWQQQAIDRVHPVALDLAAHTESAIAYLNENRGRLMAPEYKDHVNAISDRTTEMKTAVNNFLDYGDAQRRAETLGRMLEIADS